MSSAPYRVVFVRHGESEWNSLNLFCGWHDAELSDKGKWDAVKISAEALKRANCTFDVAFASALTRANQTLELILSEMNCSNIPVHQAWRLNERHYGGLTGFNKRQMAEVYGEEQVQIWRRSFDVSPPRITCLNPYYNAIRSNCKFRKIPTNEFPDTETLKSTMMRVIPYWEDSIVPEVRQGKRVLIVAHGTSLRGLVKHIESLTETEIMKFNLPNSIPFYYDLDETMKPVGKIKFLADDKTVLSAMDKVASIDSK